MFPDITCDECACIRLKKCLVFCVELRVGCLIAAALEILVGAGGLIFGIIKSLDRAPGEWEAAFRSLVYIGSFLLVLGILALVCVLLDTEGWLCLAFVLHVLLGVVIGCVGLMIFPFKKNYYADVFVAFGILLSGWTAIVLNSYRLNVMNWEPEKQGGGGGEGTAFVKW